MRPTPFAGRFAADHRDKYAPDGVKNQIEGNMLQSLSRTLKEEVRFDKWRITSVDWGTYPILTFSEVPEMEIVLLDRPDESALGAGKPSTVTTAPAVANAVFDATGVCEQRWFRADKFEEFQGIYLSRTFSAGSKTHAERVETGPEYALPIQRFSQSQW